MPLRKEIAAATLVLSALPLAAQDADNGAELAASHCSRCHDISLEGEMKTMPPSFASIAAFRDVEQIKLRIMFPEMHSIMPAWSMMFSNAEVDDLVAYIIGLE